MPIKRIKRIQAAGDCPTLDIENPSPSYTGVAYSGGVMYPKGAPNGIVLDLSGLLVPEQTLINAREHDPKLVVGNTTSITNDKRTLTCTGLLTGTDETVLTTARRAKAAGSRFPWQLSVDVELNTSDVQMLRAGQTAVINGQKITGPMPIVRRSVLRRIDFVTKGGDRRATVAIQAAAGESAMTFKDWLASLGFTDPAALTPDQTSALQKKYDEEQIDATEDSDEVETMAASSGGQSLEDFEAETAAMIKQRRVSLAAESARQTAISQICENYSHPSFEVQGRTISLEAHAIEQGWSPENTELNALRESRAKAPAGKIATLQASSDALVASQLMAHGFDLEAAQPYRLQIEAGGGLPAFMFAGINDDGKQRVLEAASHLRGLSSMDFAREAIELSGLRLRNGERAVLEAAGSSASLSNVISTLAGLAVLVKFSSTTDSTEGWCQEDMTGANFLPTRVVGMKVPGGSLPRLDGGTAKHGHLSDKGEAIQITRFAEQINIDEMTLINDQLGEVIKALSGPGGYADKAANVRPELVYSLILANAAMDDGVALFHATHRNLQTSSALTTTTMGTAVNLMQLAYELGKDGRKAPINCEPTHVIVPPAISFAGDVITGSTVLNQASTTVAVGTKNPFEKYKLDVVTESRLQLGLTHPLTDVALSGSAVDWFLVSAKAPPILVRYLRSSGKSPQVRTVKLQEGKWGFNVDVKLDIGAIPQRFQSFVCSRG